MTDGKISRFGSNTESAILSELVNVDEYKLLFKRRLPTRAFVYYIEFGSEDEVSLGEHAL